MTYSIGELAHRTGLTVKTIRYYSNRGLVTPEARNAAGHRLYGGETVERLEIVRALRSLGVGLDVIQRVLAREVSFAEVADAEAATLSAQIRALQSRQAVLAVAARYGIPVLPPESSPDQLEAWYELVALCRDEDFQGLLARLVAAYEDQPLRPDVVAQAREAVAHGVPPGTDGYLRVSGDPEELVAVLTAAMDPRWRRYRELVTVVNGWSPPEELAPLCEWAIATLRAA